MNKKVILMILDGWGKSPSSNEDIFNNNGFADLLILKLK